MLAQWKLVQFWSRMGMSLHMLVDPSHLQRETTVSSSGSVWLRSMVWNSFGITFWVTSLPCWRIMRPCSSCRLRRWKVFCPDGPWRSRNTISTLSIARANITTMLTHYPRKLTGHSRSLLPVSHCQLQSWTSGKANKKMPPSKRSTMLRRYRQLWSQLVLTEDTVCRQYSPSPTGRSVTVPIIPSNLRSDILKRCHDAPGSGHLGYEKTLTKARTVGYWVSMSDDVNSYCHQCTTCKATKLPTPTPAPLANIPIGHPWQMVAVDVLEVLKSYRQNRYLLVIQDYITKWAHAIPMPNQTAATITAELVKVFSMLDCWTSSILTKVLTLRVPFFFETLHSFGVKKSRTTAYHPQGDGMVERFNRSLLQLLVYVQDQADWERYLPLVLFAYCTAVHLSTRFSPFELMFGRPALTSPLLSLTTFDVNTYHFQLRSTLARLYKILWRCTSPR